MPFPLLRVVGTYLNIEVLMPPERLHWSRLLGRPMLSQIVTMTNDGWGDDLGPVFIEEMHGRSCVISYITYDVDTGFTDWYSNVHVDCIPGATRAQVWGVKLTDQTTSDAAFGRCWMARHGHPWPMVGMGVVHPVVARLYQRHLAFHDTWLEHIRDRREMTRQLRLEMAVEESESDEFDV